jgi:hypothetical protein
MIARIAIEEAKEGRTNCGIHDLVDPGERKGVLMAVLIETGVIDAHSPFTGFLFYKHWIGEPIWVFTFTDESSG